MNISPLISRTIFSGLRRHGLSVIRTAVCAVLVSAFYSPLLAANTAVRMVTTLGTIDIELYDDVAPQTVANFLRYAGRGDYNNSIIHRNVPGFIVQGGAYSYLLPVPGSPFTVYAEVPTDPPVQNEFLRSNIRGTIAMAKLPGDPNSATNQWFFNLDDNSANLDYQNGGFTVFGKVIDTALNPGMSVVDAIAAVPAYPPRATCVLPPDPNPTCASIALSISLPQSKTVEFLDFPLVNYSYDPITPPAPVADNLVSVLRIPNVAAAQTLSGILAIFTTEPELTFNTGSTGTVPPSIAVPLLSSFSSPPAQYVNFNNEMFRLQISGSMDSGGACRDAL